MLIKHGSNNAETQRPCHLEPDYYQALSQWPNLLALSAGAFQVRFGSLADIGELIINVRSTPKADTCSDPRSGGQYNLAVIINLAAVVTRD